MLRWEPGLASDAEYPPSRGENAFTQAVAACLKERADEVLNLDQILRDVRLRFDVRATRAEVRSAAIELSHAEGRHVQQIGRLRFVWTADGNVPDAAIPTDVSRMIRMRSEGVPLAAIGKQFGLTRERVRQLLKKYGGPTAQDARATRAAAALAEEETRATHTAGVLSKLLSQSGPITVEQASVATGITPADINQYWPPNLRHLMLWTAGHTESRWTDDQILDLIREAALYEYPLTTSGYNDLLRVGQITGPSLPLIWQRFGSWSAACTAAGVVHAQALRTYQSRWTDSDLLQVAKRYFLDPNAPNSAHQFDTWKRENASDGPSFQTLRKRFGSWTEVKRRALMKEDPEA